METLSEEGLRAAMLDTFLRRDEAELLAVQTALNETAIRLCELVRRERKLLEQITALRALV